jgi:hypothetical protein
VAYSGKRWDAKDEALLALMVGGSTVSSAAAQLGISPTTAFRRTGRQLFKLRLHESIAGLYWPDAQLARKEIDDSLRRLVAVRDDPDAKPSEVIRACEAIVDMALALHRLTSTEPRLLSIEAQLEGLDRSDDDDDPDE